MREVLWVGAVKLDKNMQPCGSYQIIVKPKHFKKIHRMVSSLTGITQEMIDMGTPLPEAAKSFRKWCGKDFVFLTWGPDDIPMLKENFNVHKLPTEWLDKVYDLQVIFNKQTDGGSKQRSLEYAMEHFEIPQRLPAHDALNDAYFTALVAAKLDVAEGIASYDSAHGEHLASSIIGDADAGDDGYVTISEMLEDEKVTSPICPRCKKTLKLLEKPLHSKGQKYTLLYSCEEDGNMLLTLKMHRNFNDTWRARMTLDVATDEKLGDFRTAVEKRNVRRKTTRRTRRKKKPQNKENATV